MQDHDPRPREIVHLRLAQPPSAQAAQRREHRESPEWERRRQRLVDDALERFAPITEEFMQRMRQRTEIIDQVLTPAELQDLKAPPGLVPVSFSC